MMSSSSPQKPSRLPRAPAKSTPFASRAGQTTRSHLQRSSMTNSLRKAKRGQTVAKKRHIALQNSSSHPLSTTTTTCQDNPYGRDARHVEETIELATSIVRVCSEQGSGLSSASMNGDTSTPPLPSLLERMCVLLTPEDTDNAQVPPNRHPPAGASYDSSMAGIAANSLLSQFVGGSRHAQNNQSIRPNLAFLLADALAHILNTTITIGPTSTASYDESTKIKATIIMNQLAATEPPPPVASSFDQEQFSPYGHPPNMPPAASIPTSWCYVLVHSQALSALVQQLPLPAPSSANHPRGGLELCEKCVWAIGNLAGDSEMARDALRSMGALPGLIGCLSLGVSLVQGHDATQSLIDLMRNSVWALTNSFREGGVPASHILDMDNPHFSVDGAQIMPRLSARDVSMLLSAPEALPPLPNGNEMGKATWYDVAIETCWLVSFLTRDPSAVGFLCQDGGDRNNNFVSMLVFRLVQATDGASEQLNNKSNTMQDMGCLIPCCRALKNIAIASDGIHAHSILLAEVHNVGLSTTSPTETGVSARPAESSFAKLISFGTLGAGNEATVIALEAAAAAGACLYDAGLPMPNPATNACQTLLPALCRALTCPLSTFDFRREVVWAVWNAVDFPADFTQESNIDDIKAVRDDLLAKIVWASSGDMARALTSMLSSFDTDALEASLCLINLLLRWGAGSSGKKLSTVFEEAGLVDALWRICDNDSEESANAEQAADILDDFYEQEDEDDADETLQPASLGAQFQFQTPSIGIPEGGFHFGAAQHDQSTGMGRGRGQVLPAWCNRNS
eukprot:CAMPEP_0181121702 /NCGR_PEP_ID=MMETSP1071-20121207/24890_1 /TAXON_ID=35127 /ORGANISM="Thalassiosira sp., Strain NH16" /LENGTH=794 /DNA_ID=CAMNT_0023206561 /DNA_START=119 /DNA_END=2506 /DNA_ORIENTATION=+